MKAVRDQHYTSDCVHLLSSSVLICLPARIQPAFSSKIIHLAHCLVPALATTDKCHQDMLAHNPVLSSCTVLAINTAQSAFELRSHQVLKRLSTLLFMLSQEYEQHGDFRGCCSVGFRWQDMENTHLREHLQVRCTPCIPYRISMWSLGNYHRHLDNILHCVSACNDGSNYVFAKP